MSSTRKRLCLVSRISGIAGPASFQRRLATGLARRGIDVTYDLDAHPYDAILLIGASRQSRLLDRQRHRGIPILQRLDGMNWIHRRRWTGLRHFLRAEANNFLLRTTRDRLADIVVYQSEFVRSWWEGAFGPARGSRVIYNGIPLEVFAPDGPARPKPDGLRIVVLEGAIGGGYEIGLHWAADLARELAASSRQPVQLVIAGRPRGKTPSLERAPGVQIAWLGEVAPDAVPELLRSGDLLFSADVHPACPNSVLEALACGLPVVAFDTGALPEIVDGESGAIVPYGADPWKLEAPDTKALAAAAQGVLNRGEQMRRGARTRAERAFGLERMVDEYLAALGWL
ncbi:MAG TPA: glycosyltransferase family 4 protein [Anaerolineales bacterium]|nr:glycosyltransferase family 4 protein [Anaerolineales bacterium]